MSTKLRNDYGALTPEGMVMYDEMENLIKPFCEKWLGTFSRDEILAMTVDSVSLHLSEQTLIKTMKRVREERKLS